MSGAPIGKFTILGTLGAGAHSSILHVRRTLDAKHYALKVVPINGPEDMKFLEQAQHEYRVAQMLDHPNLIKISSLEIQKDWFFKPRKVQLLIEYVNGRTLDTLKQLPIPKLVQIFGHVAAGLVHLHRRNVNHADLKPGNILLSRVGEVKIIDYGLAWIRGENKARLQGTPEYMAPEQAKRGMVNDRTDIYNFGATMYRLTTWRLPPKPLAAKGELPLDARSWDQILKPVEEFNPDAPPGLCDLIRRCLAFNSAHRPERMSLVKETLDQLREEVVKSPDDGLETIEF